MKNRLEAEKWLARAKSNICIAKIGKVNEDIVYEDLGNNCQAAGEKSLKALLVLQHKKPNYKPPYGKKGHDLKYLIKTLEKHKIVVPEDVKIAATSLLFFEGGFSFPLKFPVTFGFAVSLTDYAVDRRYPGSYKPLDEEGYKIALARAEKIVAWVEKQIQD
jgi:HEPN domain-containing protein